MPNLSVHRTAAAESDCGDNVTEPPRPVTLLFGKRGPTFHLNAENRCGTRT
jgi:hypothetical protein